MSDRWGVGLWSLPMGRWFKTQVRLSPLMVIVAGILMIRLGASVGLAMTAILIISLVIHELAHVSVARLTGGNGSEILIWPLGGLASVQPGPGTAAALLTIAAGPLSNLLLALAFFPGFYAPDQLGIALNPLTVPVRELHSDRWLQECCLLAFSANWMLGLVNLLPVFPLDGGQFLSVLLQGRMPADASYRVMAGAGTLASLAIIFVGLSLDHAWLVGVGAVTLLLNVLLVVQIQGGERYEESFMGYDFSQGYTSLERSSPREAELRPTWWEQWQARRRERRRQRDSVRRELLERQLDELLAKVHENGLNALTESEKRLLKRASEELRQRTHRPGS